MELAWETHSFGCNCISILKLKGVDGFSTNLNLSHRDGLYKILPFHMCYIRIIMHQLYDTLCG